MKFLALVLAAAGLVASQSIDQYFPSCSVDCLEKGVADASDCNVEDAWCICVYDTYVAVVNAATSCVIQECGADVATGEVLPAAVPYCSAATSSHEGTAAATATPSSTGSSTATAVATTTTTESASSESSASSSASESSASGSAATPATTAAASTGAVSTTATPAAAATAGPIGLAALLAFGAAVL
ncbi:hypothetical protein NKR23_g5205 [Pleurostoma richardsiae]|uniref:CFEM domain-containing protein n=1 Tax=Pleurostoma richardsiae TaxID=41990 RepID=A0AA38VRC8_9PEZI|nr:hypothetical protein NKR23_g5205 [Pleurostoma richardsiae]